MKLIVLISTLLIFINARALEEDNSNQVSDLMFFPEVGMWELNVNLSRAETDSSISYQNRKYSDSEAEEISTAIGIGYTFEGNIKVGVTVPYAFSGEDTTSYGVASTLNGTSEKTESNGLGDITLNFDYRVLKQDTDGFYLDVDLNFSPKTGSAESGSTTQDGNNFRGGSTVDAGVEIGKKFKSFSYSAGASLDFNGSRKLKSLDTGSTTNVSSHTDFSVFAGGQLQPNDYIFLNGGLNYTIQGDFDTNSNGGSDTNYDVDPYLTYLLAFGVRPTENIAIRLGYSGASLERTIKSGSTILGDERDASSIFALLNVTF